MPVVGLGGSTIAVLVATLPGLLGGRAASAHAARLAYIGRGSPATELTPGGPRPAASPVLKRLLPAAPRRDRVPSADRRSTAPPPPTAPIAHTAPSTAARHVATGGATVTRTATTAKPARMVHIAADAAGPATAARSSTTVRPAATAGPGYVNPLAHASVTPERIDQGVDYGGSGDLAAIGAGQITYVGTSGTGWPGAFIEFRLLGGPDAGRYVFYAEGIVPAGGLRVGQTIRAGQKLATLTGSSGGIEIGWGAGIGTETYAMKVGQWKPGMDGSSVPTASGKSFSALIASLGGPPGKIEG